jgi:hypothetical protein
MACDLQVIIPNAGVASLQAEVGVAVFASGDIRLELRIKSLSDEARSLIDSRKAGG